MIDVYLDLDGVMVNLDAKIQELFGKNYKELASSELWGELGKIDHLFLNLDPMPNYLTLFNYLKTKEQAGLIKLEILTSLPYSTNKLVSAKDDKIAWVREHLDKDIKVNTVVGGAKKARYVNSPKDILIDDMERNIDAWNQAGGRGILFKNNADTMATLDTMLGGV